MADDFELGKRGKVVSETPLRMVPLGAHPELSIRVAPGVIEFRVENRRGRKGISRLGDFFFVVLSAWTWYKLDPLKSFQHSCLWLCIELLLFYFQYTSVIYESIIVLSLHGIQLETHRGVEFPFVRPIPLVANRRFIPLTSIRNVVINEGLRRWNVRYYICIIRDVGSRVSMDVAFENILPRFPVLEVVYNEIQTILRKSQAPTLQNAEPLKE